jgi:DnaJ-domain-containing protein 1
VKCERASRRVADSLEHHCLELSNQPSDAIAPDFVSKSEIMSDIEDATDGELPVLDPYETLDLERSATASGVKNAYRKAALKNHPGMPQGAHVQVILVQSDTKLRQGPR